MDTNEDFDKKFYGTIGWLVLDGKKFLVVYRENDENNCYFYSPTYGSITLDWETAKQSFTGCFPNQGLYNINNCAISFSRIPERQWKRSIHSHNTKLTPLIQIFGMKEPVIRFIRGDIETYDKIFNPFYPKNLDEAIKKLNSSLALNTDYAISQSSRNTKKPELLFWYRTFPIGTINPEDKEIKCEFPLFEQEVFDFVTKKEPEWKIRL